jgi:(+)-trans-carveol dehydrogenase
MGRVEGKVAFVTGAARGMGRSHAVRLAEEGADVIACDLPPDHRPYTTFGYRMATPEDAAETVRIVEALGRRIHFGQADIRDRPQLRAVLDAGLEAFGRLDIVVANAGGDSPGGPSWEMSEEAWDQVIDTNLKGTWNTLGVTIPVLIEAGRGGSIVVISSGAAIQGVPYLAHYSASKHGITGMTRAIANEVARHYIRINSVCPTTVNTTMIQNEAVFQKIRPDLERPTRDDVVNVYKAMNLIPEPWIEPVDVSNAVLFLASDEARYITGVVLPVDLGTCVRSTRGTYD